jgi:hypothetical protein
LGIGLVAGAAIAAVDNVLFEGEVSAMANALQGFLAKAA